MFYAIKLYQILLEGKAKHNRTDGDLSLDNISPNQDQSSSDTHSGHINSASVPPPRIVKIFYRNQFSKQYKNDELALKRIFKRHIFEINVKLELLIYYKNLKTTNLLMKNNLLKANTPFKERSHIVYEFICRKGECISPNINNSYIGLTTMTLKERMSAHRYQGSIFKHYPAPAKAGAAPPKLRHRERVCYRYWPRVGRF